MAELFIVTARWFHIMGTFALIEVHNVTKNDFPTRRVNIIWIPFKNNIFST